MKRNFFLYLTQIYGDITFFLIFLKKFFPLFNLIKILIFFKLKLQMLIVPSVLKIKPSMKRNFFLCLAQIYQDITFFRNFSEFFFPVFNLVKIFILKQKRTSNAHSSVRSENKSSMKRNFSLYLTQIYRDISLFLLILEFFFHSSTWPKF